MSKLSQNQKIGIGGGVGAFISLFLPWHGIEMFRSSAFSSGFLAWGGILLAIAGAVILGLKARGISDIRVANLAAEQFALILAGTGLILVLLRWITEISLVSAGLLVGIISSVAVAYGTYGAMKEAGLGMPTPDAFKGQSKPQQILESEPQQIVGTPQSVVSSDVSVEPPAPTFDDPEDAVRWNLVHSLDAALADMMAKNSQCFKKAESADGAFAMANTEFFNGVRQHESSKAAFRRRGEDSERELVALLGSLREATSVAQSQWEDLVFLLPGSEHDVKRISDWCMSHSVDSEVLSSIVGNGMLISTDFGLTRNSFWAENERVVEALKGAGD